MKINTVLKIIGTTDNGESIEFDFKPDDAAEPMTFQKDNTLIVGYLSHDDDMESPLDNCDGMGKIHTAHKNAGKEEHKAFFSAIGRDEYGDLNDDIAPNTYAVKLDCYQHGGTAWAVSGSEMARNFPDQQFDTGHGVGVWVPDDSAQEECDRRAEVYAFLVIDAEREMIDDSSVTQYKIRPTSGSFDGDTNIDGKIYSQWHEAFDAASAAIKAAQSNKLLEAPTPEQIENGKKLACAELAAQACDAINTWSNGENYGIVMAAYTKTDGSNEWEVEHSDECWGYLGAEDTIAELKRQFEAACDELDTDNSQSLG